MGERYCAMGKKLTNNDFNKSFNLPLGIEFVLLVIPVKREHGVV